jgi:hypothetical protein
VKQAEDTDPDVKHLVDPDMDSEHGESETGQGDYIDADLQAIQSQKCECEKSVHTRYDRAKPDGRQGRPVEAYGDD